MELSLDAVTVALGGKTVLHDVSLDFAPGKLTAVLGPNGAGKSTLASVAAGLRTPDSGAARLGGRGLDEIPARERARLVGYLPQSARVHWDLKVAELVALGRLPHRGAFAGLSAADREAIAAAMAATDTTGFATRGIATLSGGEAARAHLARVLAGELRWIIADEPLAGLDPAHQLDVLARLRDAAAAGAGVVLILHDLSHAARMADTVVLMDGGRIVAAGAAADVLTPDRLASVYGIEIFVGTDRHGAPVLVPVARTP